MRAIYARRRSSPKYERIFMQYFYYHDMESLQSVLEQIALKTNGGICESYNYCPYCKEPQCIVRTSSTPCAEAFLACGVDHVYSTYKDYGPALSHRKIIKYKKLEEQ